MQLRWTKVAKVWDWCLKLTKGNTEMGVTFFMGILKVPVHGKKVAFAHFWN